MNNYKLNAHLIRKPDSTELKSEACEIVKWIPIPRSEFKDILDNPLRDNRAVTAARGLMYSDKDSAHCIMLLEEGGRDGILVESEGYDYARYDRFVPLQFMQSADFFYTVHSKKYKWQHFALFHILAYQYFQR